MAFLGVTPGVHRGEEKREEGALAVVFIFLSHLQAGAVCPGVSDTISNAELIAVVLFQCESRYKCPLAGKV